MRTEQPNEAALTEDFEFTALAEATNYRAALVSEFAPYLQGKLLEVGAGIGQMTALLARLPKLERIVSVEPDERFCGAFRKSFPEQTLIQGTVAQVASDETWNAVLSINVLEHIREDTAELASYARLLRAQHGCLCLFVPARPEIFAPLDSDFGHHRRYTRDELRAKLEQAGFEILRLHYYNFVGYFAWWFNFCLLKKRRFDVQAVRWFDRLIFPPTHWLESHVSPPFIGQSLFAVARAR